MSVRFAQTITPETINNKTPSDRRPRSKIPLYKLAFSSEQKSALGNLQKSQPQRYLELLFDESNQADAHTFLKKHKLDPLSLDGPGTKWGTQWSNNSMESYKHVLLQCVFETALQQLHNGATLTEVQEKNREMVEARWYCDQSNTLGQYWYLLCKYDSHSLYRQFYQAQGIDLKKAPHLNIHNWLNPQSSSYNPTLSNAIFHYSAQTEKENRLEVCIATNKMKEAGWRYGHCKQILLDGTFGVCDQRLLLFVVMGVDERNHGIPLAFLLFSAPTGNKFTSSGYDTSILIKLLSEWKGAVSLYRQQEFRPVVAITNTDFKERGALLNVFPGIRLLICWFHLCQAWSNH